MFIDQLFNGLSVGSILLLIAIGLAITFGLMGVINMAHGELMMVGAYTTYVIQQIFAHHAPQSAGMYFVIAIPSSFLIAALLGWGLEKSLIRHLYHRPLDSLLATWGISLILQQTARLIFGAPNVAVVPPSWLDGGIRLFGAVFPYKTVVYSLSCIGDRVLSLYVFNENKSWPTHSSRHHEPVDGSLPRHCHAES